MIACTNTVTAPIDTAPTNARWPSTPRTTACEATSATTPNTTIALISLRRRHTAVIADVHVSTNRCSIHGASENTRISLATDGSDNSVR